MDNNTNDSNKHTTSMDIELKVRKEKINQSKIEEKRVKTPRRYNPMDARQQEQDEINNRSRSSELTKNSQGLEDQNSSDFSNASSPDFNNKNIDAFQNDGGLQDEDIDTLDDGLEEGLENQESSDSLEDQNNKNNISSIDSNDDNRGGNELQRGKNNIQRGRNNINPQQNTYDPTQRKLDRLNNQKKAQNDNREPNPSNNVASPSNPQKQAPKTKGSAPQGSKTTSESSQSSSPLNKANQVKNALNNIANGKEDVSEAVKGAAKEKIKSTIRKKVVEKLVTFFHSVILPVLPYIGIALLVVFLVLLLYLVVSGSLDDEDNVVGTIKINYCEQVNIKWGDGEDQNVTVSANDYIKYKINTSEYKIITNEKALFALIIVLRTNLYANSDNLDSNICYYEVKEPYVDEENEVLDEAMKETDNKVFSVSTTALSKIDIDEKFTYRTIQDDNYRLYQDKWSYNKSWVDKYIGSKNISNNTNNLNIYSFSPFGAWYLAENNGFDAISLIFHYVTPGSYKGNIYKVAKISSGDYANGEYDGSCNDISLSMTSLDKEEFIDKVNSYNNNSSGFDVFKKNAGKIYDISINNNFNPEMVVIRAIAEGLSPGGSTNNYWGIGCSNNGGGKDCVRYPTFDQGVVNYINTVKKINSVSLFQMQRKYAYIGSNWYNPGGPGVGGCYYFPYIKKYMSEERASEVEGACASGATCSGPQCLPTTDEDQDAYTRYQIESMLRIRGDVFGITADECSESEGATEDVPASELGKAVSEYAVRTYDSWRYSQANRHQNGFVDCSSMVSRAYLHFNVRIFNSSDTSGEIYRWCESNKKTISGNSLAPGDLIFYNTGSYSNSDHYKNIGHVAMYIGNNKRFAANGQYTGSGNNRRVRPAADQVSVSSYSGNGNLFCRPAPE